MEYFSNTNHKLSDNSTKATVTSASYFQNTFGNISIRSTNQECHCWQFKVLKCKESYGIDIGIVEDTHLDLQTSFTAKGYGYGLCSNGNIYSVHSDKPNYRLQQYRQRYKQNDIVLMTLDLNNKTLSFVIDTHKSQKSANAKIIIPNIKTDEKISYKMAVYLSQKKDSIKLLTHIKTLGFDEKMEKKQQTMQCKVTKYEEMICKLQSEYSLQKRENKTYKNTIIALRNELEQTNQTKQCNLDKIRKENEEIINELQSELCVQQSGNEKYKNDMSLLQSAMTAKDSQLKESQNMSETLERKLNEMRKLNEIKIENVYKQNSEQIQKLKMDSFRLSQQNEENKQSNKRLQSRILTLQKQNQSLRNNRDQTQRVNLSSRKQIESLQNENEQLKKKMKQSKSRK